MEFLMDLRILSGKTEYFGRLVYIQIKGTN